MANPLLRFSGSGASGSIRWQANELANLRPTNSAGKIASEEYEHPQTKQSV
jgi:hypothetical protein